MATKLWRVAFPYCLQRQSDGRYVALNRDYKPVGFMIDEFIDYDKYPIAVQIRGLGPEHAASISFNGDGDLRCIYLYNDGCKPDSSANAMQDYLRRLAILAKLPVENKKARRPKGAGR